MSIIMARRFGPLPSNERQARLRSFGVLFQSGALWSSMTLAENVGLPLGEYTELAESDIAEIARLKLALVGLKGFEAATIPPRSPAGCASGPDWPAPWPWTRTSSFSTSPPPDSTPSLRDTWTGSSSSYETPLGRRSWSSPTNCRASSPSATTRFFWTAAPTRCEPKAIPASCFCTRPIRWSTSFLPAANPRPRAVSTLPSV